MVKLYLYKLYEWIKYSSFARIKSLSASFPHKKKFFFPHFFNLKIFWLFKDEFTEYQKDMAKTVKPFALFRRYPVHAWAKML